MSIGQGGASHAAEPLADWCVSCSYSVSCMGSAHYGHLGGQASGDSISSAVASPEVSTHKQQSLLFTVLLNHSSVSLSKVVHLATPNFNEERDMPSYYGPKENQT